MSTSRASSASSESRPEASPVSFDEFKLYFESAERVTERRQSLNRFNYSVSVAIVLAIAAISNLAIGREQLHLLAAVLVLLISALAAAFCSFWIAQINDAKQLNNAKFKVLNDMAPRVIFDSSGSASPSRSFKPFEKEWEFLQSEDALTQTTSKQGRRLMVLRGSSAEYFVPKSFRLVFGGTFLAAAVLLCLNFNAFVNTAHVSQKPTLPAHGPSSRPSPTPSAPPPKDDKPSMSPSLTSQS